jgi:hypothetical protein
MKNTPQIPTVPTAGIVLPSTPTPLSTSAPSNQLTPPITPLISKSETPAPSTLDDSLQRIKHLNKEIKKFEKGIKKLDIEIKKVDEGFKGIKPTLCYIFTNLFRLAD